MIRGVVFDLDDTLFLERDFAMSGYAAVASAFAGILGPPGDSAARMRELYDGPFRGRVFNRLCEDLGLAADDALIARMVHAYRAHPPSIALCPDADRILASLADRYRLGLISDGPLLMQSGKVTALRLPGRIGEIILTDQWGRQFWKPHPRAFESMMASLGLPPDALAYVADNAGKDFVAPKQLGWRTVQVARGGGVYAETPPAPGGEPDHRITTLDELPDLLGLA